MTYDAITTYIKNKQSRKIILITLTDIPSKT